MPATYININGEQRDASALDMTGADRVFRDAWTFDGPAVEVDMNAAKELWKDKLRAERAPMLADLDVQSIRAREEDGDVAPILADKQKLRDVTADPRIAAAVTPAELKALTLEVLLG